MSDYEADHDHDDIDPTGGCGWDSIDAGGGQVFDWKEGWVNAAECEHDGQPDEAQEWHDFDPDC